MASHLFLTARCCTLLPGSLCGSGSVSCCGRGIVCGSGSGLGSSGWMLQQWPSGEAQHLLVELVDEGPVFFCVFVCLSLSRVLSPCLSIDA